jgi:hypothetical protein
MIQMRMRTMTLLRAIFVFSTLFSASGFVELFLVSGRVDSDLRQLYIFKQVTTKNALWRDSSYLNVGIRQSE